MVAKMRNCVSPKWILTEEWVLAVGASATNDPDSGSDGISHGPLHDVRPKLDSGACLQGPPHLCDLACGLLGPLARARPTVALGLQTLPNGDQILVPHAGRRVDGGNGPFVELQVSVTKRDCEASVTI